MNKRIGTVALCSIALSACSPHETSCGWECVDEAGSSSHTGRLLLEGEVRWDGEVLTITQSGKAFRLELDTHPVSVQCLEDNMREHALVAFPVMRGAPRIEVSFTPIPSTGTVCLLPL